MYNLLDPRALHAFYFAAKTENFTHAASLAGLTQSGISQHIVHLEEELNSQLFLRVGRKVHLTAAGRILLEHIESEFNQTLELRKKLGASHQSMTGLVSYAMPESCLFTPHFPFLLDKQKKFPHVHIKVELGPNAKVEALLERNQIDFGFVTQPPERADFHAELFAKEEYILVGQNKNLFKSLEADDISRVPFVFYPGFDTLFKYWWKQNFPKKRGPHTQTLVRAGEINNISGAVIMVKKGLGISIFPSQCVAKELSQKEVFAHKSKKTAAPINPIYIIYLKNRILSERVMTVIQAFREMKKM